MTAEPGAPVRRDWVAVAAVVGLFIGVPTALALVAGTFGLPHNDDFTFSATAIEYRRTGGFRLAGDEQMVLIGHVLWGQPFLGLFGGGLVGLHLAGVAAAGIGLIASFAVLRRLSSLRFAIVGSTCVALMPGYALLAGTFHTDVTAFAGQMACLAVALAALSRDGRRRAVLLTLSCACGVGAFSSRQTAVPALIAVAVAALWQSVVARKTYKMVLVDLVILSGAFTAVVALWLWRFALPGQLHLPSTPAKLAHLFAIMAAVSTLAVFLAPLSWMAARAVMARPGGRRVGQIAAFLALPWLVLPLTGRDLLLGNLFTRRGANDGVIGGLKADIFPSAVWIGLQVLALFGLLCLLTWACNGLWMTFSRRAELIRGSSDGAVVLLAVFTVLALAAAVAPAVRGTNIFDRYLWPAGAGMAGLLVRTLQNGRGGPRAPIAGAAVLITISAVLAAVSITEASAFDRARWRAGEAAVASGVPAGLVDAGYEWTGYHAPRPLPKERPEAVLTAPNWWSRRYSAGLPCVVVMASPLGDQRYELASSRSYDPPASPRRHLLVYRLLEPCLASSSR